VKSGQERVKIKYGDLSRCIGGKFFVPEAVIESLGIEVGKNRIRWGNTLLEAEIIKSGQRKKSLFYYPEEPYRFTLLSDYSILRYNRAEKEISIGPVIGVLLSNWEIENSLKKDKVLEWRDLGREAEHLGITLYFFSPEDVDWERSTAKGIYYDRLWKEGLFPLPDYIYEQVRSRKKFCGKSVAFLEKQALQMGIPVINSSKSYDRWSVHNLLNRIPEVQNHLPETKNFKDQSGLIEMLDKYGLVYFKPRDSLDYGIFTLKKSSDGTFSYQRQKDGNIERGAITNLHQIHSMLLGDSNAKSYIIQRPISPYRVDQTKIGFRAILQKDAAGDWKQQIVTVAVGEKHRNIKEKPLQDVLKFDDKNEKKKFLKHAEEVSCCIAAAADEVTKDCAEVQIDYVLDDKRNFYFIEFGFGIHKDRLKDIDTGIYRKSIRNVLEYMNHLYETEKDKKSLQKIDR
jgi:hypothetical protein